MPKDKDTQDILTEADHVKAMTESEGWKSIKGKLDQKILDLQNMANLDRSKPLEAQIDGRMYAADIFFTWLKNDVYGFIEQQEANNRPKPIENEPFIEQH